MAVQSRQLRWETSLVLGGGSGLVRERGYNGGTSLNNYTSLLSHSGLPLRALLAAELLTPSLRLSPAQPTSVLQVCSPNLAFQHQSLSALWVHISGWGAHGCGMNHLCMVSLSHSAWDWLWASSWDSEAPAGQLISYRWGSFPTCDNWLNLHLPVGYRSHPASISSSFLFFYPIRLGRYLSCPFRVFLETSQECSVQVLCENCFIYRVIILCIAGRELMSF